MGIAFTVVICNMALRLDHPPHYVYTAFIKMVVSRYINNGSKVLGCFLDASKAFDRVDHCLLFQKLAKRGIPHVILNFYSHGIACSG